MRKLLAPTRPDWMDEADCAQVGDDWWYPRTKDGKGGDIGAEAKQICRSCPVRLECLEYALEIREEWGIWGGLTPAERRNIPRGIPLTADLLDRLG